jgi:TIR domain-containing protein
MQGTTCDVFLSYSRRDGDLAGKIERELRKLGIEASNAPDSISAGEDWRHSIKAAIRKADCFLAIVSTPETTSAGWTTYELGMAEALGKRILLLLSHKYSAAQLPADLTGLPIIPFDPALPERAAREVSERLLAAA